MENGWQTSLGVNGEGGGPGDVCRTDDREGRQSLVDAAHGATES